MVGGVRSRPGKDLVLFKAEKTGGFHSPKSTSLNLPLREGKKKGGD